MQYLQTEARINDLRATGFTYSNVNLGDPHPDRHIFIVVTNSTGGGAFKVVLARLGGLDFTIDLSVVTAARRFIFMGRIPYPTGTTADLYLQSDGRTTHSTPSLFAWNKAGISLVQANAYFATTADRNVSTEAGGAVLCQASLRDVDMGANDPWGLVGADKVFESPKDNVSASQMVGMRNMLTTGTHNIVITHPTSTNEIAHGIASYV